MDIGTAAGLLGTGGAASVLFQLSKGDWNVWLTKLMAVVTGFGAGAGATGDIGNGLVTASAALATHSLLGDTPLGKALKVSILPRVLRVVSEVAKNLAEAIENKPSP